MNAYLTRRTTTENDDDSNNRRPAMNDEIENILTCPISYEFMKGPVTLFRVGKLTIVNPYARVFLSIRLFVFVRIKPLTKSSSTWIMLQSVKFSLRYDTVWNEPRVKGAAAQCDVAIQYFQARVYERARHFFYQLAAKQGHSTAQNKLGQLYSVGFGVRRDYEQARHYYKLAAYQGHVTAQYNLGCLYQYGEGVPQDYKKAKHYLYRAAE